MDGNFTTYMKNYQDFFNNILSLLKYLSENDFEQVFKLLLELRKWADDSEMRELLNSFLLVTEFEEAESDEGNVLVNGDNGRKDDEIIHKAVPIDGVPVDNGRKDDEIIHKAVPIDGVPVDNGRKDDEIIHKAVPIDGVPVDNGRKDDEIIHKAVPIDGVPVDNERKGDKTIAEAEPIDEVTVDLHSSVPNGCVTNKLQQSQTSTLTETVISNTETSKSIDQRSLPQEAISLMTEKTPGALISDIKQEIRSNSSNSPSSFDNLVNDFLRAPANGNENIQIKLDPGELDKKQGLLLSTYYYDSLSSDELESVEDDELSSLNDIPLESSSSKRPYTEDKEEIKRYKWSEDDKDDYDNNYPAFTQPAAAPAKIGLRRRQSMDKLRNNDKAIHSTNNQYSKRCLLCSFSGIRIVSHYVNQHPTYEVFIARPSSPMANLIKTGKIDKSTLLNGKIQGICCFCEVELVESKEQWIHHFLGHTGEFSYCCIACNGRFSDESMHPKCGGVQAKLIMLNTLPVGKCALNNNGDIVGYMCNFCNYTQLKESNMRKHLTEQHNIIENRSAHYEMVILMQHADLKAYTRKPATMQSNVQAAPVTDSKKEEKRKHINCDKAVSIAYQPKSVPNGKLKTSPQVSNPMDLISKREAMEKLERENKVLKKSVQNNIISKKKANSNFNHSVSPINQQFRKMSRWQIETSEV